MFGIHKCKTCGHHFFWPATHNPDGTHKPKEQ